MKILKIKKENIKDKKKENIKDKRKKILLQLLLKMIK